MIYGARKNLTVDRWVPFVYSIDILGFNLTGAAFRSQVRLYPDAAGDPLLNLPQVTDGANGVRFLGINIAGPRVVSTVQLQIDAEALAGLPSGAEAGDDIDLAWDLIVTPANDVAGRWLFGTFTVRAGVTHG